ncbi:MAG TPA: ribose 5-phosphate isomerase B [Bacteroidales bacterium]|jgi:ribose 5-phosphate isomerase B|nr:ribose 5-phosphate isomerase B [Bacteroidales bacterium]MDY0160580.1 ribose 5-phosphate isomerase B [Bacteroidales bacterium]HXK82631.1 ribose 5-phosphate isomerase B [Bacteroidales bacterium]
MKTIGLACDHAGFKLKEFLIGYLESKNFKIIDFGTYSEESADYPDFAHPLAEAVEQSKCAFGISICGSGNGINMTVNKHQGIRSALCWNSEIASLARQHNNANICALPARFISTEEACNIIDAFLHAEFEGGRHQKRIDKIPKTKNN